MQNQAGANAMAGRWKPGAQSTAAAIPQQAAWRRIGKQRRPHVVILLCLVTFGLYSIIYYYCTSAHTWPERHSTGQPATAS